MRFIVHPAEIIAAWPESKRAYVTGADGRVFPTRVEFDGNVMEVRRNQPDSGKLNVVWPVPGFGRAVVTTSSLREQEEPYLLPIELARGKISKVRDQVGAWEVAGMAVPPDFVEPHRQAHRLFGKAVSLKSDPEAAGKVALEALQAAFVASELLARSYIEQRLAVRRRRTARLPASLGCYLGMETPADDWEGNVGASFNAAVVPIEWRSVEAEEGGYHWETFDAQVEWCQKHKMVVYGGPLLDFSRGGLPAWLETWLGDPYNLQSFVSDFVETAISRYVGRIRHWEVSAYGNTGEGLQLDEEHRLALVAKSLEIAQKVDQEVQLSIRIDRPWGEYQAGGRHGLSPYQFVDALHRSGVGLSAVNLEIAVGFQGAGSPCRDLLDVSQLVDRWSLLGIPLHVTLAYPAAGDQDVAASEEIRVGPRAWKLPFDPQGQAAWTSQFLPLLMAKQSVVGIFWTHYSDVPPHRYPHSGLVDANGAPRPALGQFQRFNAEYWPQS
jgi:hypothetical protein